jgi:lipoate-protein ligase A
VIAPPPANLDAALDVVVTTDTDPPTNLALEDALLLEVERGARPETLRLWVNRECIVRGPRRSRLCGWHREERARDLGVPIYERTTGGGSVYHDPGNLNWSFYLRRTEGFVTPRPLYRACAQIIAAALRAAGIEASFALPNRIDVAGRKVSGLASRASLGAVLVHGTLLISTDLDRLNEVCIPPPDCPPVANLGDFAPRLTVPAVVERIAGAVRP